VLATLGVEFGLLTVFGRIPSHALHLTQALGVTLECLGGGLLYRRYARGEDGGQLREVAVVLAAGVVPPLLISLPMAVSFRLLVPDMVLPILPFALDWATAESMGVVLLAPLVLSPRSSDVQRLTTRQVGELVAGALLTTGLMASFFFTQFDASNPLLVLSFVIFPLFVMAGYIYGLRGAVVAGVVLTTLVTAAAMMVLGPFSVENNNFYRHTVAQLFVLLVVASSLVVGALTDDKRRARRSLDRALQQLHDSTSRLQALFAAAAEAITVYDQLGVVLAVNEAFIALAQRACGTQPMPGEPHDAFERRAGQLWLEACAGAWARALRGEPVTAPLKGVAGCRMELRFTAVRDASGAIIGVAQGLVDVDAATREQQRQARGERLESLGRLAGGIAHDFNNLLAIIMGHATLLTEAGLDPESAEDAGEIVTAAERAGVLTRQLLQFARREQVEPRVVDLAQQVRTMQPLLARLAGESIQVVVEAPPEPLTLSIAPGHLEQVLLNVVANARDAMPEGGHIWLRLRAQVLEPTMARERDMAPGPAVVLEVRDEGTGIPPRGAGAHLRALLLDQGAGQGHGPGPGDDGGHHSPGARRGDGGVDPGAGHALPLLLPPPRRPGLRRGAGTDGEGLRRQGDAPAGGRRARPPRAGLAHAASRGVPGAGGRARRHRGGRRPGARGRAPAPGVRRGAPRGQWALHRRDAPSGAALAAGALRLRLQRRAADVGARLDLPRQAVLAGAAARGRARRARPVRAGLSASRRGASPTTPRARAGG
jgi:signal transduction histidine kinase